MLSLMDSVKSEGKIFHNPVLIIRGLKSGYITDEDAQNFLRVFPKSKIEDFETGHWVHAEEPDKLTGLLKQFLPG